MAFFKRSQKAHKTGGNQTRQTPNKFGSKDNPISSGAQRSETDNSTRTDASTLPPSSQNSDIDEKPTTTNTSLRDNQLPEDKTFDTTSVGLDSKNVSLQVENDELPETNRHKKLGLSDADVVSMYRLMLEARILDQKMWALNRSGKAPFAISSQGHEATHAGIARAIISGTDYVLPYYRDLGLILGLGVSSEAVLLAHLAKKNDKMSGGRQMPNHWSVPEKNVITGSSPIATQLPHAVGVALALEMQNKSAVVFTTFGDGGASKGDFHEAMNFAGIHKLGIVFICENNGYAISVPLELESAVQDIATRGAGYNIYSVIVDGNDALAVYEAVSEARARASAGLGPTLIEAKTYRFLAHTSDDDDKTYRTADEVANARAHDPLLRFAQYLIESELASQDNLDAMANEIQQSIDAISAQVAAQEDPDPTTAKDLVFRKDISFSTPAHSETNAEVDLGEEITLIDSIRLTLEELLDEFPNAMILGEDVGRRGGVFKTTDGLQKKFGTKRVLDTPLAESGLVGIGIGLSMSGILPIVEIQFADFIHSAFDQIVSEAARIHYRSLGAYNVPLVIRTPFGAGVHGGLYHSQSIETFYSHVPGIKVVVPSTIQNAAGLLRASIKDPDPVLFLEHKRGYRLIKGARAPKGYEIPIGRAEVVRKGTDLSIITYGLMRHYALMVAESLAESASIEVIDLLSISPLDSATIIESARRCSKVLVVHEDNRDFGVGAEVSAIITENAFYHLDAPVARLAPGPYPMTPFSPVLENALLITPDTIKSAVLDLLRA